VLRIRERVENEVLRDAADLDAVALDLEARRTFALQEQTAIRGDRLEVCAELG
jgi:hypothetical protein